MLVIILVALLVAGILVGCEHPKPKVCLHQYIQHSWVHYDTAPDVQLPYTVKFCDKWSSQ